MAIPRTISIADECLAVQHPCSRRMQRAEPTCTGNTLRETPDQRRDLARSRSVGKSTHFVHQFLKLKLCLNIFSFLFQSFQGSQGRAYLFNSVVNVGCGPAEERVLLTGLHAVADIYCECCKTTLGWKYEHAFESSQKYKEGKYIIELAHMIKDNGWD
nr:protein yippee-like 2 [Penaeus vannamei]